MSEAKAAFALPPLPPLRETRVFGCRIRYYDVGDGPPLVLLHGVGGDADQWAFCFERLALFRRVVAIDLPGFGRSDKPQMDYRIAGFVEMVDGFLSNLAIERAAVLGHSLGGWIAASLALHAPRRVDHLILNDSAGIDRGATTLPVDLAVSTRRNVKRVFEAMFHDAGFVTDDVVDYAYRLHLERGDHYAIKSVLETLASPDEKVDGQLARLDVPTLLLWGDHDAITPLAMARAFQQGIRGARLQSIPDCGHVPCLEKPAQFVDAVEAFLR